MRTVLSQRLDVGDAQLVTGHPETTQAEILGDGVVFTVASALPQGLDRRLPIVDFTPQVDVFHVAHLFVEKQVHHLELFQFGDLFLSRQQLLPRVDPLLPFAQWPI